ncbi:MAG: hypothetical protein PHQ27_11120, partial [Victivallales bacterium]|nr:hypothetical protein [Victivallales bacterium]
DRTCPPTSVYAAYNNIPRNPDKCKVMVNDIRTPHSIPRTTYKNGIKFIMDHAARMHSKQ